jgi:hypothetical protein
MGAPTHCSPRASRARLLTPALRPTPHARQDPLMRRATHPQQGLGREGAGCGGGWGGWGGVAVGGAVQLAVPAAPARQRPASPRSPAPLPHTLNRSTSPKSAPFRQGQPDHDAEAGKAGGGGKGGRAGDLAGVATASLRWPQPSRSLPQAARAGVARTPAGGSRAGRASATAPTAPARPWRPMCQHGPPGRALPAGSRAAAVRVRASAERADSGASRRQVLRQGLMLAAGAAAW